MSCLLTLLQWKPFAKAISCLVRDVIWTRHMASLTQTVILSALACSKSIANVVLSHEWLI